MEAAPTRRAQGALLCARKDAPRLALPALGAGTCAATMRAVFGGHVLFKASYHCTQSVCSAAHRALDRDSMLKKPPNLAKRIGMTPL